MPAAIVFPEVNRVEFREIDPVPLGPRDVRVRTEYSGVSQGTEVWALKGDRREIVFPTVPGYQSVGIIEEVGEAVGEVSVGQRLLFHTVRLPDSLPETWMGAHVGEAVTSMDHDIPPRVVPNGVDPVAASLAAMPAVAEVGHSMIGVNAGDLVVVIGQGLIGQGAAQFARLRGAVVIAVDVNPMRLELSDVYSADVVVNPLTDDLDAAVRGIKPDGADTVIDTTGRSDQFEVAIGLLRRRGQVCLQGWYPKPISFDFHETHLKMPTIVTPCGIGDTAKVLYLMQHGRLDWRPLITEVVSPIEAPTIYRRMSGAEADLLGASFDWSRL